MSLPPIVPLFPGVPGGAELLIIFLVWLIGIAIAIGAAYWVYRDATRRGRDSAGIWAAVTAIGFFVGFIPGLVVLFVYLITRE